MLNRQAIGIFNTVLNTLREIQMQNVLPICNGCGLTDHGCGFTLLWFHTSFFTLWHRKCKWLRSIALIHLYNFTGAVSECYTYLRCLCISHTNNVKIHFCYQFERCHQIYTSCTYLVVYSNPYLREYIVRQCQICHTCVKMSCQIDM